MIDTQLEFGGLATLAGHLATLRARKVLVLAPPSRRFVDEVVAALAGCEVAVFDGARVHVPIEVVAAAEAQLAATGADTLVAIGGGSPIGLGKALRLRHDVRFVAIPTTYAGSERTTLHGTTRAGDKTTGRDPRVRPDVVIYDVELTRSLPIALTVQSLLNALAHVISTLSTGSLVEPERATALAAAASVIRAIEDLLLVPTGARAREHALRGASACAVAADHGKPGAQHALAHFLGGAFGVEHAALHSILLPQFVAHLRATAPGLADELEGALGRRDLDAYLHDLLARAGAPVALEALGVAHAHLVTALASRPELVAAIALDAQRGLRPSGRGGRIALAGEPFAVVAGPRPEHATRIVLVLHGRGAEAGTITRRFREIAGHDPAVSVIGLRAEHGADHWYAVKYSEPGAGGQPQVVQAIARVTTALDALGTLAPGVPIVLAGFSQGACLALEVAARRGAGLAGVVAPCGSRIGRPDEWPASPAGRFAGVPVLVGAAAADKWIARGDLDETVAWFRAAGATVIDTSGPGERHEITLRQRLRAREIVLGRPAPSGATGFRNTLACEARAGALPPLQNSPRVPPLGLYPEQLNGSAFTAARADNHRTWLYRVRPSAQRRGFAPLAHPYLAARFDGAPEANLCGFAPLAAPTGDTDFVDGLVTVCGAGRADLRRGYAFHLYAATRSMEQRAFYNADGDLVILPEHGALTLLTELGPLEVAPGQLAIIPRGIVFSVLLAGPLARGYVAEPFGRSFHLPEHGLIGPNGLADPRHFHAPAPWYEDRLIPGQRIVAKLGGHLHEATQDHSPFDVVAWHGNHVPMVYDVDAFSPVGNTRFDHGDPSIYTVVSAPLDETGANTLDLIVFPARVDATTGTFRPPFFHRNPVTEINGIIRESPDPHGPFQPGCAFVTPCLTAHGVSGRAVEHSRTQAGAEADRSVHLGGASLWFQLESVLPLVLTPWAESAKLADWPATWGSHPSYFAP